MISHSRMGNRTPLTKLTPNEIDAHEKSERVSLLTLLLVTSPKGK